MENCIFCKIIKNEIPCTKIYEDRNTLAFLDIAPAAKGHTLVIPKKHFETINQADKSTLSSLAETLKKVSSALINNAEGLTVLQNNKEVAGQLIPHIHFHLIPRNKNDGNEIHFKRVHYKENEAEETALKIKRLLK